MKTIVNGLILKGLELEAKKENILIDDDGTILEISKEVKEGEIIDADNKIVCPRFLNAHTHIGDSIIKDEGEGLSLDEVVKPPHGIKHVALESADDDVLIEAMRESMWDMYNMGVSHFIDYREGGLDGVKLLKEAAKDIPITPIILARDSSFYGEDANYHMVKMALKKLLKESDGIGLSGFGEISTTVAEIICERCEREDKISSIHVAENELNQIASLEKTGKSEPQRAFEAGFNQIVHMTNPKNDDVELLARSDSSLTVCPRSNGALAVGVVPLYEILNKGVRPLIGTDNIMINSPNMFRELEFTLKIMKGVSRNHIDAREILKMATTNADSSISNLPIDKSYIGEGQKAELMIVNKKSNNPYLSLINRTEANDIVKII
ncbi:amidohydrolase [Methanobrevibacter ruminantium M1]|uniref:Amidohydrolase n=1 Tax=Methanobrevibacter ruminantium (strain ATCC 35063 / DSM 1093 / JCM 13430 / OCM 146 / M1) TaxID=634498 RepID=D3E1V4_METRM|nr:amidohydrolase family protein [Methanobrevibacter ruminantium]ADC46515.1 amidohydrolase [Methanobrevibacter ruminantium M1]